MQQEEVSTRLGWSFLHIDRRSDDNGSRTVDKHLPLLVSKEIAQQEDCHEEDSTEETYLAQHDMRTEEINQYQNQRHDDGYDACLSPTVNTRKVDQRLPPGYEEHLAFWRNLIDGLASCKLQVEADVFIAWREQMGTLIIEHSLGNIVCTVISIAQVIVNFGRNTIVVQYFLIVAYGLLIVTFLIFRISIVLGYSACRNRAAQHHHDHHDERISGCTLLALLTRCIDSIFYIHNSSHC